MLTKGYPRFVMDIFTLSFFKKQNLDVLLTEHEFLLKHYKFLIREQSKARGADPYYFAGQLLQSTDLKKHILDLDTYIYSEYKQYKTNDKYLKAFKDFYINFYKLKANIPPVWKKLYIYEAQILQDDPILPKCPAPAIESQLLRPGATTTCQAPEFWVENWNYYEAKAEQLTKEGVLKQQVQNKNQNQSNDLKVARLFYFDNNYYYTNGNKKIYHNNKKTNYFENSKALNKAITDVASDVSKLAFLIKQMPFIWFVLTPEDDATMGRFVLDYSSKFNQVESGTNVEYDTVNEFSWYIFEALRKRTYTNLTCKFMSLIASKPLVIQQRIKIFLTAYMGLPYSKKGRFLSKMAKNFPELTGTWPSMQVDEKNGSCTLNTSPSSNSDVKMVSMTTLTNFLNKNPIFAHVYLNDRIRPNTIEVKQQLYDKIMKAYDLLMFTNANGTRLEERNPQVIIKNLKNNSTDFKEFVNSITIMDLFLTEYQPQMTKLYEQQNVSNQLFFKALWGPYYEEIWDRRIMQYYKRVFDKKNMNKTYVRFLTPWRSLGRLIKEGKRSIETAFKKPVSLPADPPVEADTSPVS
jgi:hypothetical protein